MQTTYDNFDLEFRKGETGYVAAVLSSPFGEPSTDFTIPFTAQELRTFGGIAEHAFRGFRLADTAEATTTFTPDTLGERLFWELFEQNRNIYAVLQQSLDAASEAGNGLRIRLRLGDDVAELAELPWEYLYHPQREFLALSKETPLVRYIKLDYARKAQPVEQPLRILAVISDPKDVPTLDVEQEWGRLQEAVADIDQRQIQLERLPAATLGAIQERLRADDVHVIHFIGHGYYDDEQQIGGLVLENEAGNQHQVHANQLRDQFATRNQLRLLFLNACDGARSDHNDAFAGTAQKLVQSGLPIVVAMQYAISDKAAIALAREFYASIAAGYPVDTALSEARLVVSSNSVGTEWGTPVLFSRLDDNQLVAATPTRVLLEAMQATESLRFAIDGGDYLPLTVDVIHTHDPRTPQEPIRLEAGLTAGTDFLDTICDLFADPVADANREQLKRIKPPLVILTGGYGTNKSTQLFRLAVRTMQRELGREDTPQVLPLYIDFKSDMASDATRTITKTDDLLTLIETKLNSYGPTLTRDEVQALLEGQQVKMQLLFDHLSALPAWERTDLYEQLNSFIERYTENDYVLSAIPGIVDPELFADVADIHHMSIQPLMPRRIRHFLQSLPKHGDKLLQQMNDTQLFDLAANPGVLVKLVRDFQHRRTYRSRTQTMERILRDSIAQIPPDQGMRSHAQQALLALAWEMQTARRTTWLVSDAFVIMDQIRGNRGYRLEEFYDALQKVRLITAVGDEHLSFAQSQMQDYCSAKALVTFPNRTSLLDDIMATLGRPTRLRWWQASLIFLCGLLTRRADELEQVLQALVYGVNLLQSDQTFLAARCLLEARQQGYQRMLGEGLAHQIVEALVWRLYNRHEPDAGKRARAVRLLSQFADKYPATSAGRNLIHVTYTQTRLTRDGRKIYDRSNVRLAAAVALLRIQSKKRETLLADFPTLINLFEQWQERNVLALIAQLHGDNIGLQSLAALALGEVHGQLKALYRTARANDTRANGQETTQQQALTIANEATRALRSLTDTFADLNSTAEATRWAVTHALTYLDEHEIYPLLIAPFLAAARKRKRKVPKQKSAQYQSIAYLIGRLRLQETEAHDFLIDPCLTRSTDPQLWAVAIEALRWLANPEDKPLLEAIAVGDFSILEADQLLKRPRTLDPKVQESLQYNAILALATVGDGQTIDKLRTYLSGLTDQPITWQSSLLNAHFEASEEIYGRIL